MLFRSWHSFGDHQKVVQPIKSFERLTLNIEKEELRKSIQKFINKQSMLADSVEKIQQENDEEAIHLLGLLRK